MADRIFQTISLTDLLIMEPGVSELRTNVADLSDFFLSDGAGLGYRYTVPGWDIVLDTSADEAGVHALTHSLGVHTLRVHTLRRCTQGRYTT